MSTKKHLVAFAAQLVPAILFATSINVTFDTALTNATAATQWEYSEKILISQDGGEHIYFKSLNSFITLRECSLNITSVVLRLSCSNSNPPRRLYITTEASDSQQTQNVTKENKIEEQQFFFPAYTAVRSFKIILEGSTNTGSWHLYSAVISGVPLIEAPTNLQSDEIKGTRCRLSWENPENAVSNRIDVSRIINQKMAGEVLAEYDFSALTNSGGKSIDRTADFIAQYPNFAGSSLIYTPAHTAGNIQISTDDQKGFLVHAGLSDCSAVTLLLSLKIPNNEQGMVFGIGYETTAGTTNEVAAIPMDLEFKTNRVSLAEIPSGTPIIFNTQGANSKRRVIIDYLAFIRDYSPASVSTNLVKTVLTTGNAATIRGLSPNSSYIASITAFDADGNESEPSEPISFMTNGAELPLVIKLQ